MAQPLTSAVAGAGRAAAAAAAAVGRAVGHAAAASGAAASAHAAATAAGAAAAARGAAPAALCAIGGGRRAPRGGQAAAPAGGLLRHGGQAAPAGGPAPASASGETTAPSTAQALAPLAARPAATTNGAAKVCSLPCLAALVSREGDLPHSSAGARARLPGWRRALPSAARTPRQPGSSGWIARCATFSGVFGGHLFCVGQARNGTVGRPSWRQTSLLVCPISRHRPASFNCLGCLPCSPFLCPVPPHPPCTRTYALASSGPLAPRPPSLQAPTAPAHTAPPRPVLLLPGLHEAPCLPRRRPQRGGRRAGAAAATLLAAAACVLPSTRG